jgi:hypothetical protein
MAGLNEEGQWIILMGILVSIGIFFLAFIINQSTLVGQTTAEGVLEFPKNEIQDTRSEIFRWASVLDRLPLSEKNSKFYLSDMATLGRNRRNAEVWYEIRDKMDVGGNVYYPISIHYNNGVTVYDEALTYFISGA